MTTENKFPNQQPPKKNGGARPGAGRPKGRKNLLSAELKELAQSHGQAALETIVSVMLTGESGSIRLAAAKELLDRGYGKPLQQTEIMGKDGQALELNSSVSIRFV